MHFLSIKMYICFIHRSSGGTKGDSESEADPFIQPKTTNNKYNKVNIFVIYHYSFHFLCIYI